MLLFPRMAHGDWFLFNGFVDVAEVQHLQDLPQSGCDVWALSVLFQCYSAGTSALLHTGLSSQLA